MIKFIRLSVSIFLFVNGFLTTSFGQNQNIIAANWYNNVIDVVKIGKDGSVTQFWCMGGGQQWGSNVFAKPNSAATQAGITAVSRVAGVNWDCWWIGSDGSVQAMSWTAAAGLKAYQLAPAGSASVTGGIKSLSKASTHMEVWWIAPDGAIRGRYYYNQWNTDNLLVTYAPAGSASKDGTITGVVLNKGTAMELLYTGPQGQINGVWWLESDNKWRPTEYVSAANATIAPTGCVYKYVKTNGERQVYWINKAGNIRNLTFNTQNQWVLNPQTIATGADPNGCISAVSRDLTFNEIWFTASDGTIKGASSLNNSPTYSAYTIPNSNNRGNSIAASSRGWDCLELYWLDKNDNIQSANYYMKEGAWKQNPLPSFKPKAALNGYIDMHTHPMAHLAFGRKFLHGAPDIGSLMSVDQGCNKNITVTTIEQALGHCDATHGGVNIFNNTCGDIIRNKVIEGTEGANGGQSKHGKNVGGFNNNFKDWPVNNDITHQTMWVDWIRRTYENGLRVMVALSVNNQTLAAGIAGSGDGPIDDKGSSDLQIEEMKKFVQRHTDFMEIAYSPNDLNRIVANNKLAIILGVEVDNIGNFNLQVKNRQAVTQGMVSQEIQRLYNQGVRYIFPIHVTDNAFGGTALYTDGFSVSNFREYGSCWDITCATPDDGINFRFNPSGFNIINLVGEVKIGVSPAVCQNSPNCGTGQKNNKGLTSLGEFAIREMMKRGMMIDVDHMSLKSVERALEMSKSLNYPVTSGHNGLRHMSTSTKAENTRTVEQYRTIAAYNGMLGIGWNTDAEDFRNNFNAILEATNYKACGLGTDMNGLVKAPRARYKFEGINFKLLSNVIYDNNFKACTMTTKTGTRTWNYNAEGVAHYGLIPDFLKDVQSIGGDKIITSLFNSAEDLYQMWTKCEWQKGNIR